MASQTTVQLKRSSVAGKVPDSANVEVGEPVVNLADKKVYTKNVSGNVIQIASGNLQGLADVSNATPLSNQVLAWNGVTWAPSNVQSTSGVDSVNGLTGVVTLTTTNIAEGSNLYYTNARVYSNVIQLGYITNTALNGYATNSQLSIYALNSDLTTANVTELTNLYYTNARVYSNVSPLLANKADLSGATFTGNVIVTNLLPPSDDSGVVGDASRTWNNGHFTNLSVDTLGSISGTLNVRTALDLGTDDTLRLGDNDDIEIYYDGTNSYIDLNSGNLVFRDVISNRATFVRHTGDFVLSTGNSQANYFIGDGSPLTNVRVANTNITGNIISSQITSIANSQITGNIISSKLEPTGVTASTYGGAATSTVLVIDQQGRITSASNVAINTAITLTDQTSTATTQYLLLNAASSGSQSTANVSTTKLYFTPSTGQLNATAYNSLSDKRYKKEIRNIEDPINLLNQMRGVTFKWRETGTPAIGVIAQEIEKVLPSAISSNEQGILSVRYSDIIGLMIEAIKEQQKQINTLKQQIEKLNG